MSINFTSPLPSIEEDDRFPDDIAYGSSGGPGFVSEVFENDSGFETRFDRWERARCKFNVKEAVKTPEQYSRLLSYFWAMRGRLKGFRFKDWSDFTSASVQNQNATPTFSDQVIGTGDGVVTIFQLIKTYPEAGGIVRTINKPVTGTTLIAFDDTEQGSGWAVDTTTGLVTFDAAPGVGVIISAGFEFDVPCRFDTDELMITFDGFEETSADIPLTEIILFKEFYSRIIFSIEPALGTCGTGLGTVEVTVPSDTFTGIVTIALATNPNGATLAGTLTQAAVAGVATFTGLYLDKAGTYRLIATASGFTSGTSAAFSTAMGKFAVCTSTGGAYFLNLGLTGGASSPFGLIMSWYKGGASFDFTGSDDIAWTSRGLSLTNDAILSVTNVPDPGTDWTQDIVSWDINTQTFQWWRNRTDITSSCTIVWGPSSGIVWGGVLTASVATYPTLNGDLSDFYFWLPATFFDIGTSIGLLSDDGDPIAISDGSTVTGTAAIIGLHGDFTDYADNLGVGGSFLINNQPLLQAGTSPWHVHVTYTGTIYNHNLYNDAIAAGWDGTTAQALRFTVDSSCIIGSTTTEPSLQTGTGFPAGTTLFLENNGKIQGKGGNGSPANSGTIGIAGSNGGPALKAEFAISVTNNGHIWAGGGGGGSGGVNGVNGGGAGGGGAGTLGGVRGSSPSGPGGGFGEDGTSTAGGIGQRNTGGTPGGAGGGPALAGEAGIDGAATGGTPVYPGGAGGTAGKYIIGNEKVTWTLQGDVRGNVG